MRGVAGERIVRDDDRAEQRREHDQHEQPKAKPVTGFSPIT
jgi:hypothetical protein